MAEIHIDTQKAERIIAQMVRDETNLLPAQANELATRICIRLQSSMATPTKPGLRSYRMIPHWPDDQTRKSFTEEVSKKLADIDEDIGVWLWERVYERCRKLPGDVVPNW